MSNGHSNFEPGVIYVVYGELSPVIAQNVARARLNPQAHRSYLNNYGDLLPRAWKIGMTKRDLRRRINEGRLYGWLYNQSLQVVHTIQVDNMRVVESMFHQRYSDRITWGGPGHKGRLCEWFDIGDKITGLQKCIQINVSDSLRDLAGLDTPMYWWYEYLTPQQRRVAALDLWKHPLTKINLKPQGLLT